MFSPSYITLSVILHLSRWFDYTQLCSIDALVRREVLYHEENIRKGRGMLKITWEKLYRDLKERNITKDMACGNNEWWKVVRIASLYLCPKKMMKEIGSKITKIAVAVIFPKFHIFFSLCFC